MKTNLLIGLLLSLSFGTTVVAQQVEAPTVEEEMLGEHFSLEGALEMFKTSQSLDLRPIPIPYPSCASRRTFCLLIPVQVWILCRAGF